MEPLLGSHPKEIIKMGKGRYMSLITFIFKGKKKKMETRVMPKTWGSYKK